MAECQKLVRTATDLANETNAIRESLGKATADLEKHLLSLPSVAQQESARVREMVRAETEEILDISARTLATIHARVSAAQRRAAADEPQLRPAAGERRPARPRAQARRSGRRRKETAPEPKSWEMSTLLSAVDSDEGRPGI